MESTIEAISELIFMEDTAKKSDVILIPGACQPGLMLKAIELYEQNYSKYILVSGSYNRKLYGIRLLVNEEEERMRFNRAEEVIEYLESIREQYYFRGVSDFKYNAPSLFRKEHYSHFEIDMFQTLGKGLNVINHSKFQEFGQLIEFGQHYGLPTRLLDFSCDPFIALYFGLGRKICEGEFYIFLIPRTSSEIVEGTPKIETQLGFIDNMNLSEIDDLTLGELDVFDPNKKYSKNYYDSTLFNTCYHEFLNQLEGVNLIKYKVDNLNLRKEHQSGLFVMCKNRRAVNEINGLDRIEINLSLLEKKRLSEILSVKPIETEKWNGSNTSIDKGSYCDENIMPRNKEEYMKESICMWAKYKHCIQKRNRTPYNTAIPKITHYRMK